jgi:hypothetical protein
MVLPLIAAGLGAAGSIAGGIMGANATEGANKTNQLINIMNAMMRERERTDQMEMAGKVRREDKLGGVDAAGNRSYFDPERGWVVAPSAAGRGIQQLQDREQEKVLMQDLPLKRQQMQKNYVSQLDDKERETALLKEMPYTKVDPSTIRGMLFQDAQKGIDGSFDEATSTAMRGALRQGGSGIGDILAKMAEGKASATGDAFSKTGVQALQMADSMSKSNMGQLQNLINFFGGRARGLPAVQYSKQDTEGTGNNLLKAAMSAGQNSEGLVTTAAGNKGGSFDYVTPNLGYANTVVQGGQSLGNLFKAFGAEQGFGDATKRFNESNSYRS